jgi:hypothetical protein
LRKPVLEWLQKKLDNGSTNNWEAVADERGMNYEDIRAHLDTCRRNQESPFLKLLHDMEHFQNYTVEQFLRDMDKIKRRDIIADFGDILGKYQAVRD